MKFVFRSITAGFYILISNPPSVAAATFGRGKWNYFFGFFRWYLDRFKGEFRDGGTLQRTSSQWQLVSALQRLGAHGVCSSRVGGSQSGDREGSVDTPGLGR